MPILLEGTKMAEGANDPPYWEPKDYEGVHPSAPAYDNVAPPEYETLSVCVSEVKPSSSPNKRVYWYALGLSLAVAAVVGIVTGVTIHLLSSKSTEGGDGWGEWGEWGACDVTCGGGWMTRSRECLVETCTGSSTQVTECATQPCPNPEYPEWSSWQSWSECSVTCGDGTQSRERTCSGGEGACTGDDTQYRPCPGWSCPDCSEPCPGGGTWNMSCTWCECPGSDLTGRVLTSHNTPLAGVTVSPAHAPFVTLHITDTQGDFIVTDICIGQRLLFTKPGHVDLTFEVTSVASPLQINLPEVAPLTISVQPESKSRLVGESVVLCCTAIGNPPPQYYEWFHGTQVILTDGTSDESVLMLDELQEDHSGEYRCRANNDHSTIYSEPATLQVKGSEADFCPSSPLSHRVQLPYGCKTQGGALAYDVGKCSEDPCRLAGENQTTICQPDKNFCCGPTAYDRVDLVCEEGSDFIFEVVSCGCIQCLEDNQVVSGLLQAADTLEPVPYGRVQLHDGPVVSADATGHFVLHLPSPRRRIAMTVTDLYDNLVQTTKVVFAQSLHGVTYVIIKLMPKAEPVAFDASEETFLTMGGGSGKEVFAGIKIPPGSVFTDDGSVFTGDAVARLNVIDPRTVSDVENAPGDFVYVDEEGNDQMLDTYGIFKLQVEDSSGNPLHVQGNVEVSLDADLVGEIVPNIYILDEGGKWVEVAKMRVEQVSAHSVQSKYFKSSVIIGGVSVPVSDASFNLDSSNPTTSCVSKVRLYKNNAYVKPITGAQPYVVIIRSSIYQRYSRVLHSGGDTGYCIVHPCDVTRDSGTKGYVLIENKGERADPVSDDNIDDHGIKDEQVRNRISYRSESDSIYAAMSYFKQQSAQGPFYRHSYSTSVDCRDASEDENHFRFHLEEVSAECGDTEDTKKLEFPNIGVIADVNYYAWYTKDLIVTKIAHTVVYIKVVTSGNMPVVFQARSEVGNNTQGTVRVGDPYGTMYACTENVTAVCLELKPSGEVSDRNDRPPPYIRDDTFIRVQTEIDSRELCNGYSINPRLNEYVQHPTPEFVDDHKFELSMTKAFEDQVRYEQGIYWYTGDSTHDLETVRTRAYDACRTGVNPEFEVEDKPTNRVFHALEFKCG